MVIKLTSPSPLSGSARVWLDDLAFVSQPGNRNFGPSLPLVAGAVSQAESPTPVIDAVSVLPIFHAALANWSGLDPASSVVVMPDGGGGIDSGAGFFSAGLQLNQVVAEQIEALPCDDKVAGLSQGGFDDQGLLIDFYRILWGRSQVTERMGGALSDVTADEFAIDGDPSASSDRYAVQTENNALLLSIDH